MGYRGSSLCEAQLVGSLQSWTEIRIHLFLAETLDGGHLLLDVYRGSEGREKGFRSFKK